MYSEPHFTNDANRMERQILAIRPRWHAKRKIPFDKERDYGFQLYNNSRMSSLSMLVLGGIDLRSDWDLMSNVGVTSVIPTAQAKKVVAKQGTSASQNIGSVLNEKNWWPFLNDCWVMGAVHGRHDFHLASEDWPDDELWDTKFRRPRMLGRELQILSMSGYSRRSNDKKLGMVFYCRDHMESFKLRLPNLLAMTEFSGKDAFLKHIKKELAIR